MEFEAPSTVFAYCTTSKPLGSGYRVLILVTAFNFDS